MTTGKRNIPFSARGAPAGENGLGEFSQRGTSNLKCMKLDSPARQIHLSMSPCDMPRNQISNLDEQPRLPAQNWARLLFYFTPLPLLPLPLVLPRYPIYSCKHLCLSSSQSAWEISGCSNCCQLEFIIPLEITEIFKLTSEQDPIIEDVGF